MTQQIQKTWNRQGTTLVEVAISSLIVGTMLVASLSTIGAVFRTQRITASRSLGPGLAHELMSEILAMPYEDPEAPSGGNSTETGETTMTRSDFDDVDDYDDWDSASAVANDGTPLPGFTGWRREVDVWWAERLGGNVWWFYDTGVKRIKVCVTDPDGNQTVLYALRSKGGSLEQTPAVDTTAIAWIGAQLRLGGSTETVRAGIHLSNHAIDSN